MLSGGGQSGSGSKALLLGASSFGVLSCFESVGLYWLDFGVGVGFKVTYLQLILTVADPVLKIALDACCMFW